MKLNKVLIYLLVLAVVGAWIYFYEIKHKQKKQEAEDKAARIAGIERDQIVEIQLRSSDGSVIELKKPADKWVMNAPVMAKADESAMSSLLISATDAKSEKVLAEKDVKWEDYGFNKPEFTVALKTKDKKAEIIFGERNPSKTSYYARVEGDPRLFLVADTLKNSLNKTAFDLRDKTLLGMAPGDVEQVVVNKEGKETELKLEADKWVMVKPERMKAKKAVVTRNLVGLTNLQAKEIIDKPQTDGDPYGLDSPTASILLRGKKLNQDLLIGKPAGKEARTGEPDLYARVKDRETVYVVDGRLLKDLVNMDPGKIQDRYVLSLDPATVDKLEIAFEGKQWLAVKGKDNKWDLEKPEKKSKVDGWPVSAILWELKDLEWKSVLRPAPKDLSTTHLDKPQLLITLYRKDEKEPLIIKAGWEEVKPETKSEGAAAPVESEKEGQPQSEGKAQDKLETPSSKAEPAPEVKPALPPAMNVMVEPHEDKEAVFVTETGFLERLRMDLDRLLGKK